MVLKRLSHKHIIKLVGTYTQGNELGLLLWPVAVTDLASFMEEIDKLKQSKSSTMAENYYVRRLLYNTTSSEIPLTADVILRKSIGCLASAVAYLHGSSIRHKDLKPSNILLYPNGLRLTDFGTATDFEDFSHSATEGGERGTPKYFSPEIAAWEPCGRASDIFSLGCIFLEMLSLANGYSLKLLKERRPDKDRSFQANLGQIHEWLRLAKFYTVPDDFLLDGIKAMLSIDPKLRPIIDQVQSHLKVIEYLDPTSWKGYFHRECCQLDSELRTTSLPQDIEVDFNLTWENINESRAATLRIEPSSEFLDIIQDIRIIQNHIPRGEVPYRTTLQAPFALSQPILDHLFIHRIGIVVALKQECGVTSKQNVSVQQGGCSYKYQGDFLARSKDLSNAIGPFRWAHPMTGRFREASERDPKTDSFLETPSLSRPVEGSHVQISMEQETAVERFLVNINQHIVLPDRKWKLVRLDHRKEPADIVGLQRRGKGSRIEIVLRRVSALRLTSDKRSSNMFI